MKAIFRKKRLNNFLFLTLVLTNIISAQSLGDLWGDALGTDFKSITNDNFYRILDRAQTKENKTARVSHSDLKISQYSVEVGSATWHVPIYADDASQYSNGKYAADYEIKYRIIPSAFINYESSLTFTFLTDAIKDNVFEVITNSESFKELDEEFAEEYDDMTTSISVYGKQVMLSAKYSYIDGVSTGDLEEHMHYLLKWARRAQSYIMVAEQYRTEERKTELREKEFTYITKDEFVTLTGYGLDKYEEENESTKEGYYNLKLGGYNHQIYNFGDSLVFNVWIDAPEGINEGDIKKILTEINEEIKDNPATESIYSNVKIYDSFPTTYFLEVSYDLKKGIEGEELEELIDEYVAEYVPDFSEELIDLFEDYE